MPDGLSLNALAKKLGRAKSGLSKLAKTGLIPRQADGSFDIDAVRQALAANLDPARAAGVHRSPRYRSPSEHPDAPPITTPADAREAVMLITRVLAEEGVAPTDGGAVDFNAARTADTILKARQRDFAIQIQRKKFVPLAAVKAHVEKAFMGYRRAVQRMPSRYVPEMAAKLGCDPGALDAELQRMIGETLADMSAPLSDASHG